MMKEMDRVTLFAMAASKLALEDADFDIRKHQPNRVGTFIGTGVGGLITTTADHIKLMEGGPRKIGIRSIIRLMPNAPSGQVAIEYGAKSRRRHDFGRFRSLFELVCDRFVQQYDGSFKTK
jgi:3-oxoacyl-[acyl-carrier-protein] synthase II